MCGSGGTGGRWSGIIPGRAPSRPPEGGCMFPGGPLGRAPGGPPGGRPERAPGGAPGGTPTWLPGDKTKTKYFS